ncbi:MAG TPA: alpha/beta fold hydrolase [Chloroflexia bacterium]|nr:alpha/beta fold hydrolase [Chloroflexia bacterium]
MSNQDSLRAPPVPPRSRRGIGWRPLVVLLLVLGGVTGNGVAWMQAWAMTHYAAAGPRTPPPEALAAPEKLWTVLTGVRVPRPENHHTPRDLGLAYSVRQIPIGGEHLEAWAVPHAQARGVVLLFPGYAASKESLLAPAAAFSGLGYATLLVDFRGAGGSSGQETTLGVREATDVAQAVAYAQRAWPGRPLVLYGSSLGSAAILRAVATAGVRPAAVILESPFDRLLDTVGNRFTALGLPAFPGAALLVFWGSVQQGANGFADNPVDDAPAVHCPTLLLHGTQDPRVTVAQNAAIFAQLGGPKELVSFPGAGHAGLIQADPRLWQDHVARFLAVVAP